MAVPARENFARSLVAAVLPALLGLCVLPAPARAGWQDFVPTPYQEQPGAGCRGHLREDRNGPRGRRQAQSELFVKEKLTFVSDGFSYHPRFIQYHLLLAAALKQETRARTASDTVSTNGSGFDYDLRLNLLPEHPYRLNLFTSRTEPLYKQYFSADAGAVTTRSGAAFNYRKKPYFLNLRYIDSSRDVGAGVPRTWRSTAPTAGISRSSGGGRKLLPLGVLRTTRRRARRPAPAGAPKTTGSTTPST